MLASVGMLGEIRSVMGTVNETKDLPAVKETMADGVKKVIVQSGAQDVKVDKSTERTVNVFGTYRSRTKEGEQEPPVSKEQFVTLHTIGDTLYIQLKQLPEKRGIDSYYPWMQATVVLPQDVQVEIRGANNQIMTQ
jgi:hypothetical protein